MKNYEEPTYYATTLVPMVVEQTQPGRAALTTFIRALLKEHIIFIGTRLMISCQSGHRPDALSAGRRPEKRHSAVHQFPGGSITAGFAIYDTMAVVKPTGHHLRRPGCFHRGGAFGGRIAKKAFALPNARILIHQL